jgi:hypothetical protein
MSSVLMANPNVFLMKKISKQFGYVQYGDPSEIRTPDTLIKSQVLCRLS